MSVYYLPVSLTRRRRRSAGRPGESDVMTKSYTFSQYALCNPTTTTERGRGRASVH